MADAGSGRMQKLPLALVATPLVATALLGSAALADPAPAAPDFTGRTPSHRVDRRFAASDGDTPIAPLDDLAFAPGSAALGPAALAQVDEAARWLRAHPSYRLVVEASTAVTGSPDYAEDLANRRAVLVRNHLMGWGISGDRVILMVGRANLPRVVMFASDRPVSQIVAASLDNRGVVAVVWTDRGTLFQEHLGIGNEPRHEVIATRR